MSQGDLGARDSRPWIGLGPAVDAVRAWEAKASEFGARLSGDSGMAAPRGDWEAETAALASSWRLGEGFARAWATHARWAANRPLAWASAPLAMLCESGELDPGARVVFDAGRPSLVSYAWAHFAAEAGALELLASAAKRAPQALSWGGGRAGVSALSLALRHPEDDPGLDKARGRRRALDAWEALSASLPPEEASRLARLAVGEAAGRKGDLGQRVSDGVWEEWLSRAMECHALAEARALAPAGPTQKSPGARAPRL